MSKQISISKAAERLIEKFSAEGESASETIVRALSGLDPMLRVHKCSEELAAAMKDHCFCGEKWGGLINMYAAIAINTTKNPGVSSQEIETTIEAVDAAFDLVAVPHD